MFNFLIICIVGWGIAFCTLAIDAENQKMLSRICLGISLALVIGGIFLGILAGLHTYIGTQKTGEYEIVSIQESNETCGEVHRGGGYIDTQEYYVFYYKDGNCYNRGKIRVEDAIVHEKDDGNPVIIEYTKYSYVKTGNAFFDFIANIGSNHNPKKTYEIFVSRETIAQNL